MACSPITSWQIDGKQWKQRETLFSWAPKSLQMLTAAMKLKDTCSFVRKAMTNLDSILKNRDNAEKGPSSQRYGFSSSHVWMWEFDHKESWVLNWCFWTVVLEKTLENPLNCKKIKLVNPKGDQSWIFIGRTWPPDGKNWVIEKDPDAGKDWRQEEKGTQLPTPSVSTNPKWNSSPSLTPYITNPQRCRVSRKVLGIELERISWHEMTSEPSVLINSHSKFWATQGGN